MVPIVAMLRIVQSRFATTRPLGHILAGRLPGTNRPIARCASPRSRGKPTPARIDRTERSIGYRDAVEETRPLLSHGSSSGRRSRRFTNRTDNCRLGVPTIAKRFRPTVVFAESKKTVALMAQERVNRWTYSAADYQVKPSAPISQSGRLSGLRLTLSHGFRDRRYQE